MREYETPRVEVLGSLSLLTLGQTGSCNDGVGGGTGQAGGDDPNTNENECQIS